MPKKIKMNRSPFKRNQAFVQLVDCTLEGHTKGSVFKVVKFKGLFVNTGEGLNCNRKLTKSGFISRKDEIAPFKLGMSNRQ